MKKNKNYNDFRVSNSDLIQFNKFGWVNINLQVEDDLINRTLTDLRLMRENAINSKYNYGRIYYDYLFDFNLASIELPFNNQICLENVREFFSKAKIGSILSDFFNSDDYTCTLARLFCMGDYKYRGVWHRDHNHKNLFDYGSQREKIDRLQVGIYLEDQTGFRILKKDYEDGFSKSIVNNRVTQINEKSFFPMQPNKNSYYSVGGQKGSILIFDPKIFHQGSNQRERFDFHLKFEKNFKGAKAINLFQDFNVVSYLHEKIKLNDKNIPDSIPKIKRQQFSTRLFNSLNYSLPLYNLYKIFKKYNYISAIRSFGKPDIFSNTFYQKEQ